MRLNPDAIRDVLLYLEENLQYNKQTLEYQKYIEPISRETIITDLNSSNKYSTDEVRYAIEELFESGMIKARVKLSNSGAYIFFDITNITWEGHDFLNNIRPQSVWEATKEKAIKLGGMSIKMLSFFASTIIQAIASNPELISNIVNQLQ